MSVLPNLICRFNAILASYSMDINKLILKFIWRGKRPRITNTTLKKNKVEGLMLPDFKTHYKATVIKTVYCWEGVGGGGIWMKTVERHKLPVIK